VVTHPSATARAQNSVTIALNVCSWPILLQKSFEFFDEQ
jgi:hypothetical protein